MSLRSAMLEGILSRLDVPAHLRDDNRVEQKADCRRNDCTCGEDQSTFLNQKGVWALVTTSTQRTLRGAIRDVNHVTVAFH